MDSPFDQPTIPEPGGRYRPGLKVFGGRFLLERKVGRGGMGEVWLARDLELGDMRALKFLPAEVSADRLAVTRLRREALSGRRLTHGRIVRVDDFLQHEGDAGLVMEWVDGRTFNHLLADSERGFFEVDEIRSWVDDVCAALGYAHEEAGVIHRDLKPSNIIVETATGRAKVLDFGISAWETETRTLRTGDTSSGTPAYSSPQQLQGNDPDPRDDLYSLAATIYEMLTGAPPFFTGDIRHQVVHVLAEGIASRRGRLQKLGRISCNGGPVPGNWNEAVLRALGKERDERHRSIREFRESLRKHSQSHPTPVSVNRAFDFVEKTERPEESKQVCKPRLDAGGGMGVGQYAIQIPQGIHFDDGKVFLQHRQVYSIRLVNRSNGRVDAGVWIDTDDQSCEPNIGTFRLEAQQEIMIRRSASDDGRLTFYRLGSKEGVASGLAGRSFEGSVVARFWPEKQAAKEQMTLGSPPVQRGNEGLPTITETKLFSSATMPSPPAAQLQGGVGSTNALPSRNSAHQSDEARNEGSGDCDMAGKSSPSESRSNPEAPCVLYQMEESESEAEEPEIKSSVLGTRTATPAIGDLALPERGGTGVSGRTQQRFKGAKPIDRDESRAVTIRLQLLVKPRGWKPQRIRPIAGNPQAHAAFQLPVIGSALWERTWKWLKTH